MKKKDTLDKTLNTTIDNISFLPIIKSIWHLNYKRTAKKIKIVIALLIWRVEWKAFMNSL